MLSLEDFAKFSERVAAAFPTCGQLNDQLTRGWEAVNAQLPSTENILDSLRRRAEELRDQEG